MDLAQGRYVVGGLIGEGGMASVYEAYDARLRRTVAVKMMNAELVGNSLHRSRFSREAAAVAGFEHPHVVTVHDVGDEPVPYFVMERVHGTTLADAIAQGPLPADRALGYAADVLDALAASHARGMVHRDIKPANVMVASGSSGGGTGKGTVKVMDFGIARALHDATSVTELTRTGQAIGTPHYMSPEQFEGSAQVDGRSDVYSVGVTLFQLLTGAVPFDGGSVFQIGYKHVTMAPPTLADTGVRSDPRVEALIARALAKAPDDRFADAAAMLAEVQRVREQLVTAPVPPPAGAFGPVPTGPPAPPAAPPAEAAGHVPGSRWNGPPGDPGWGHGARDDAAAQAAGPAAAAPAEAAPAMAGPAETASVGHGTGGPAPAPVGAYPEVRQRAVELAARTVGAELPVMPRGHPLTRQRWNKVWKSWGLAVAGYFWASLVHQPFLQALLLVFCIPGAVLAVQGGWFTDREHGYRAGRVLSLTAGVALLLHAFYFLARMG